MHRRNETSHALVEVRTVLSRAETALRTLSAGPSEATYSYETKEYTYHADPDQDDMEEALRNVVVLLSRWRRSGRKGV